MKNYGLNKYYNGNIIISFGKYTINSDFSNSFACVCDKEQGNCYINKQGEILELKI